MNTYYQRSPTTEQFITAKISANALKQGSKAYSVLRQRSSQLQKYKAAPMSRRIAVEQKKYAAGTADKRIENAHKVRKKTFVFYYVAVICAATKWKEQIRVCVSHFDQSA